MSSAQSKSIGTLTAILIATMCLPLGAQQIAPAVQNNDAAQLSLQEILSRLAQTQVQNRNHVRPYTVSREYRLYAGDSNQSESQVLAEVSFIPPGSKEYAIKESEGSGQGPRVVRKVLAHEQEMAADWERTALTHDNYDFQLAGMGVSDGHRCYVLIMSPKRDSKDLIRGRAWVDAENFNVRKMEGELAKSPSWWVKRVQLTLTFNEVQGLWLQTAARAAADVRLVGKRVLTSQDLSYRTADVVATKTKTLIRQKNFTRTLGAGVVVIR